MDNSPLTEVHDYSEILNAVIDGQRPLLVGGHAVNLWAFNYAEQSPELQRYLPFTSKDIDLYGTKDLLYKLQRKFGGTVAVPPFKLATPVAGYLDWETNHKTLRIDVLKSLYGLPPKDMVGVELKVGNLEASVLALHILLKAKISNAANLPQETRTDVKHLNMMVLVQHCFLQELLENISFKTERPTVNILEDTLEIINSPAALRASKKWNVDFSQVWPKEPLAQSKAVKIKNFVKFRLVSGVKCKV